MHGSIGVSESVSYIILSMIKQISIYYDISFRSAHSRLLACSIACGVFLLIFTILYGHVSLRIIGSRKVVTCTREIIMCIIPPSNKDKKFIVLTSVDTRHIHHPCHDYLSTIRFSFFSYRTILPAPICSLYMMMGNKLLQLNQA